jgi:hypothetical protein
MPGKRLTWREQDERLASDNGWRNAVPLWVLVPVFLVVILVSVIEAGVGIAMKTMGEWVRSKLRTSEKPAEHAEA